MANILVVDDELEIRDLIDRILSQLGHTVFQAGDGLDAQQMLATTTMDLVITDVLMPRCSGLEFVKALRAKGNDIPVVVISGGGGTGGPALTLGQALEAGANVSVAKPFIPKDIVSAVEQFVDSPNPL